MAEDFGWSSTVSGLVQSSFFFGYMLTQIPGGYIIAKKGGRKILPLGVGLWSLATAAVPVMAGTMPGMMRNMNNNKMHPCRYKPHCPSTCSGTSHTIYPTLVMSE